MTSTRLPARLMNLIEAVAQRLTLPDRSALLAQAGTAAVIDQVEGRSVDVSVSPEAPLLHLPDGPIHPVPAVYLQGVLSGELIVWIHSGRLTGVEQPWFGDQPPSEWPDEASLDFS